MKRREFIQSAILGGTAFLTIDPLTLMASPPKANDLVSLGNTGIKASRLAIGTGSSGWGGSSNQTRDLGIKGLGDLLEAGYDAGIRFWDSADQYGTHPHLKEGLKRVSRENVVILTKTHASTADEMKKDLDRFRKEIGTDYIDVMLLHCLIQKNWSETKKGAMEVLSQAREDGVIRAHGVSCHSMDALKEAASSDWVQIDLARINPHGARMDGPVPEVEAVLKDMKSKGKSVMGMKILGDGNLVNKMDECIQFALTRDYMDSFTIGFENIDQLKEIIKKIG